LRRGGEPKYVLQGEPGDTDGLDHGQLGVVDLVAVLVVRRYGWHGV
jgi:hypothetical protein